ncbi:MAG TPA: PilZ domain-containing protein [Blastocatellia bacterium]|nr:PilZ domain-containing protein [Blastocatellia bacterium]
MAAARHLICSSGYARIVDMQMNTYTVANRPMPNRRAAHRISYLCEVEFDGVQTGAANIRISDLSTKGAFIDSLASFPVGSILQLRFLVRSTEMCVTGEVRHNLPQIGMGIRFVNLSPEDEAVLQGVVGECM